MKHSQHWNFNQYDFSILPVTWRGKTIETGMNGREMTWSFFGPFDSLELRDDMYDFARKLE